MRDSSPVPVRLIASLILFAFTASLTAHAETDVAASVLGAFTGSSEGNGTFQSVPAHIGGIAELRHISNPFTGYEANYSLYPADQIYNLGLVRADAHELGADWIFSAPVLNLRPFVLIGAGALYFHADSGQPGTTSEWKAAFVYGGGFDWTVIPHLGLRFQYRGNFYKAPNLLDGTAPTRATTHTAEPMVGAFLRF